MLFRSKLPLPISRRVSPIIKPIGELKASIENNSKKLRTSVNGFGSGGFLTFRSQLFRKKISAFNQRYRKNDDVIMKGLSQENFSDQFTKYLSVICSNKFKVILN